MAAVSCILLLSLILQSESLCVPSLTNKQQQNGRRKPLSLFIPIHRAYTPHRYILSATKTSSSSSISENEILPSITEVVTKNTFEEIDKHALVNQTEAIPLGELTQDYKRDMLTVMRQLSSMGRRQDDIIGSSKERRLDAQESMR